MISLLPIVFITRKIFGVIVFKNSFVIYVFTGICLILYSIAVAVVASRSKKEEKDLNILLNSIKEDKK